MKDMLIPLSLVIIFACLIYSLFGMSKANKYRRQTRKTMQDLINLQDSEIQRLRAEEKK